MENYIDPVCGMSVNSLRLSFDYEGKTYAFCSEHCRKRFSENPEFYLNRTEKKHNTSLESIKTYFPLILIGIYLLGGIAAYELHSGEWNGMRMMTHFMGGFFVVFSFFKFLDLKGFADAYRTYDILARRFPFYGYMYPFIELALGLSYFALGNHNVVNALTFAVMGVSTIGVVQSLIRKQEIRCACLGTVFQLPMSTITLLEDLMMLIMAFVGFLN